MVAPVTQEEVELTSIGEPAGDSSFDKTASAPASNPEWL